LTKECYTGERVFEVPIEMEEANFLYLMNYLGNSEHDFAKFQADKKQSSIAKRRLSKLEEKKKKYNERIVNYMTKIRKKLHLLNFYKCYEENPLKFIQNFLGQQNALLKVFKIESTFQPQHLPVRNIEAGVKRFVEETAKIEEDVKE
jgi:hypothetical protein